MLQDSQPTPTGLRYWLQKNKVASTALAVLMIATAIYYIIFHGRPHNDATFEFIDEETGRASVHPIDELPPLIGASGKPTVVRAIFTGGKNGDERRMLYLQKYSPEAKAYMEEYHRSKAKGPPNVPDPDTAVWVRSPKQGSPWVPRDSAEGQAVINSRR